MEAVQPLEVDALARAIDLHSLRILVAIEAARSISGAARELGLSQPTVTQHVQRLESRLGVQLVARSARSAHLTPTGALLARHAPRIDAALTAAATELAQMLGHRAGTVRFAASASPLTHVVAPTIARLRQLEPSLTVAVLHAADNEAAIALVHSGKADIAVTEGHERTASLVRSGLKSTFLFAEEIVAVTAQAVAQGATRLDARAFAKLPWIVGPGSCADAVARRLTRDPSEGQDADSYAADAASAVALAKVGLGVAFVPVSALRGHSSDYPHVTPLAPSLRRRTAAITLDTAPAVPSIAAALRVLASLDTHSTFTGADAQVRQRRALHRTKFGHGSMFAAASITPHHEENNAMALAQHGSLAKAGVIAAASAIVLAGCAVSQDRTDDQVTSAPMGVDTGQEIDNLTVALPGSLSSLYVGTEAGILNYYIASITQEGLVSVGSDGSLQPGLAESWSQPDPVTYVYEIRDDAMFQDGTPVTADDVVFSLLQAKDETASPGLAYYLTNVDTVEKTGESEVTITLVSPDAAFAANMSSAGAAFITSQAFWEEHDGAVGTPDALLLGSGPYKVTEFVPDSHVTFERVDTWWGETPKAKKITVNFIPDESTRLLAAKAGDVDIAFNVPLAQADEWEALDSMRVEYVNDLSYVGLYFNTTVAPFDDAKVREAIAHAVNKQAYVDAILRGHGEAATAIMTPESLGKVYSAEEARAFLNEIPQYGYDLEAAADALSQSAYPDGFSTEILTPNTGPQLGTAAQALAQDLAEIGITLNVREVPIEEWLASLDPSSEYGINFMWYFSTLGDPAEIPSYLLGLGNPAAYDNAEVLELLTEIGAQTDAEARVELIREAETLQAQDVVNIPLWWGQSATAFSTDTGLEGYSAFTFVGSWPAQVYAAG